MSSIIERQLSAYKGIIYWGGPEHGRLIVSRPCSGLEPLTVEPMIDIPAFYLNIADAEQMIEALGAAVKMAKRMSTL